MLLKECIFNRDKKETDLFRSWQTIFKNAKLPFYYGIFWMLWDKRVFLGNGLYKTGRNVRCLFLHGDRYRSAVDPFPKFRRFVPADIKLHF